MSNRTLVIALVAALAAAAGAAYFRSSGAPPEPSPTVKREERPRPDSPHGSGQLPPNHPPIGAGSSPHGGPPRPSSDEPAALEWKTPAGWQPVQSASAMRLATLRPPRAAGDTEDAELSVIRAGGTTEANIQRWVGQFDDAGKDERAERTVNGLKVTVVQVSGTFTGGGMMGGASSRKQGWSLLGAIVEAKGSSYFFKMVGPQATVKASKAGFDELIASLKPTG